MDVRNLQRSILAPIVFCLTACASQPLSLDNVQSMEDGQIIASVYLYASKANRNETEENNLKLLIDTAEQKAVLDIASLTTIRRFTLGGFWPATGDKVHDIELLHGPPTYTRQARTNIGNRPFEFTVLEYYFSISFRGGSITDNRLLCTIYGVVYSYAVYIELRQDRNRSLLRTSSDPMLGCGAGRSAYFSDDIEYRGVFGNIRMGKSR